MEEEEEEEMLSGEDRLIKILEKQKQDLVIRFLKKHEEAEANRSFIDKMMASLPDLIIVLSASLQIVQASREFYLVLGYEEENKDLQLRDITSADNCRLLDEKLKAGEFHDLETTLISRSGSSVPVIVRGTTHVTETGRTIHMLVASDRRDFYEIMNRMREVQIGRAHV
jgi:PAS domain-containing protein